VPVAYMNVNRYDGNVMIDQAQHRVEIAEPDEGQVQAHEEEESSIDFLAYLNTLYRGRRTVAVATLGAFAIATAIAFLAPLQFTSRCSFIPPSSTNSSVTSLMGQLGPLAALGGGGMMGGAKSTGDLYVGILKSQSVESEIVKRFNLMSVYKAKKESQAEGILADCSKFDVGAKDSIVTISVTDSSPQRAQNIGNAYLDALRETNGRLALSESSQRRVFFGQQLAREKDALADAEVDLKKVEEQTGLISPEGQTAAEIQMIAQTRNQIAAREVQLSSLRESATPQNPELIRLQSEIDDLEGQLVRLQMGTGKSRTGAFPTSKVPELVLEYVRKNREVKYHETLFDMLARQYEAAQLDESHQAPLLQVLDAASYPDVKSGPQQKKTMLGGLILGFLAGGVWVLVRERIPEIRARFASVIVARK
jgi:tyrosine-protein kinase Etk/Wzc